MSGQPRRTERLPIRLHQGVNRHPLRPRKDTIMARTKPTTEVEATEAQVENVETAPQATENTETVEAPIDLADFESSIEQAVSSAGASGEPTADAVKAVQEEYRKLDGNKPKAAARTAIKEGMKAAVKSGDLERAKVLMQLDEEVKSSPKSSGPKAERKPVDPTDAYLQQRVTLHLGYSLLVQPEGLAEDTEQRATALVDETYPQAQAYLAWLQADKESRGDEPEVSPVAKAAAKLAVGKKVKASGGGGTRTSSYNGPQRSVKAHIASAFADVPSGTFLKVSEIVKHTSEEYGSDHPSPGAVTASLKSAKFDVAGISPDSVDGHQGARKA